MSSLYLKCNKTIVNSGLVQLNSDGTKKCPLFWTVNSPSELSGRYQSILGEPSTIINNYEILIIDVKTVDREDTNVGQSSVPKFNFKVYVTTGAVVEPFRLIVYFEGSSEVQQIYVDTNAIRDVEIDLPENINNIAILNIENTELYVFEDYNINIPSRTISNFNSEFGSFDINPYLVNSIVLSNKVRQRKLKKTEVNYTFDLILTKDELKSIEDVLNFARTNRKTVSVYINYEEDTGKMVANFSDEAGYKEYLYITHSDVINKGMYYYTTLQVRKKENEVII